MSTKNSDVVELVSRLEEYFRHHPIKSSSGETLSFSRKPQTLHFEFGGAMLDVGGKSASDTFPCSFWTNVEGLPRGKGFGAFRALEKPATAHSADFSAFAKDLAAAVTEWFSNLPSQASANEAASGDGLSESSASGAPNANASSLVTREMAEMTSEDIARLVLWVQKLIDQVDREFEALLDDDERDDAARKVAKQFDLPVDYFKDMYYQFGAVWALKPVLAWLDGADAKYEQRDHEDDTRVDVLKIALIDRAATWHPFIKNAPFRGTQPCIRNLEIWYTLRNILTNDPWELSNKVAELEKKAGFSEKKLVVPAAVAKALAKSPDADLRYNAAANATTPAYTLVELSTDPDPVVRNAIARNANTPLEILATLATDSDSVVRYGVAMNTNALAETLDKLSTDDDQDVRCMIAENSSTSKETLTRLSADPWHNVRYWVAQNANTPFDVLESLCHDDEKTVREKAKERLKAVGEDGDAVTEESVESDTPTVERGDDGREATRKVTLPAGQYYVGDNCYVIADDHWMDWLNAADHANNDVMDATIKVGDKEFRCIGVATMYGDGTYSDNYGLDYPVDAGMIGVVPCEYVEALDEPNSSLHLAHLVTFDDDFEVYRDEEGTIWIGDHDIDTVGPMGWFAELFGG